MLIGSLRRRLSHADPARRRLTLVALAGLTSLGSRSTTILVLLIVIPIAGHALGAQRFGLFMAISSIGMMSGLVDLGLGNSALGAIAQASGSNDHRRMRQVIASALVVLTLIGALLIVVFLLLYRQIEWHRLFHVTERLAVEEAGPAVLAFMLCLGIGLPTGLVNQVQGGLQRGFSANLWMIAGSLFSIPLLVLDLLLSPSVPVLIAISFGVPLVFQVANSLKFFVKDRPYLRPTISAVDLREVRSLIASGALIFLAQVGTIIALRLDTLIVAQYFGAAAAGRFAVVDRIFAIAMAPVYAFLAPLWPAYREAVHSGDARWVTFTFRRSILVVFLLSSALSIAILIACTVTQRWLNMLGGVSIALVLAFVFIKVVEAVCSAIQYLLNGIGLFGVAALSAISGGALSLLVKRALLPGGEVEWIGYVNAAILIVAAVLPLLVFKRLIAETIHQGMGVPALDGARSIK